MGGGVEVDRCDRVPGGPTLPGVDRAGESGVVLSEELQLGGLPIVGVEPLQRIAVCDSGLMTLLAHGFEGSLELIEQARTPDGTLAASRLVSPFTVRMTRRYEPVLGSRPADTISSHVPGARSRIPIFRPTLSRQIRGRDCSGGRIELGESASELGFRGAPSGTRTQNQRIKSPLL